MNEQEESKMLNLIKSQAEEIMSKIELANLIMGNKSLEAELEFGEDTQEIYKKALKFQGAVETYKAFTGNKNFEKELESKVIMIKKYSEGVDDYLKAVLDFYTSVRVKIEADLERGK